jgi:hypothetical protein
VTAKIVGITEVVLGGLMVLMLAPMWKSAAN